MRAIACLLVLLGGCRQLLGFDEPIAVPPGDAASNDVSTDVFVPGARKKQITIDSTKVAAALASFPVWVTLDDPQIAARASADGSDIYFTLPDGTPLTYELQRWEPATTRVEAWVKLDLGVDAPTVFEIHYGESTTTSRSDPSAVFTDNFAAVWHLEDTLASTTIVDATGARDGTAIGFAAGAQVTASVGGGLSFDGVDDQIDFANPLNGNTPHTISAWVTLGTAVDFDSILTVGNALENRSRWFHAYYGLNDGVAAGFYGNDFDTLTDNIEDAGPTLLHWVFEDTSRVSRIYRDGVLLGMHTHGVGINTTGPDGHIGFAPTDWGPSLTRPCYLFGTLDEVRIATVARSPGYVATEYANQSSPATFYSVGPELEP